MNLQLRLLVPAFVTRILHRMAVKLLHYSLKEKSALVDRQLSRFPETISRAEKIHTLYGVLHKTEPQWPRFDQSIRLDIRRGKRLYTEASELYAEHIAFVGPRLLFPQLDSLEEILLRISSAYTEAFATLDELSLPEDS